MQTLEEFFEEIESEAREKRNVALHQKLWDIGLNFSRFKEIITEIAEGFESWQEDDWTDQFHRLAEFNNDEKTEHTEPEILILAWLEGSKYHSLSIKDLDI